MTPFTGGETPPATLLGVLRLGYAGQIVEVDATVLKGVEMTAKSKLDRVSGVS